MAFRSGFGSLSGQAQDPGRAYERGERRRNSSRPEEAIRLLGEKKILTIQLPEGWEKARQLTVYAVEKDKKKCLVPDFRVGTEEKTEKSSVLSG